MPQKPVDLQPLFSSSANRGASECSDTTGQECQSSETCETLTPFVELWGTPRNCTSMAATVNEARAGHEFPNIETQMARHVFSSPPESRANLPLPQVSEEQVRMTVGSGRRLSRWLSDCGRVGACLRTLLESPVWRNPLRYLEWRLKAYGILRDEPCVKSSRESTLWDMSCQPTETGYLGFRLCRLQVLEPSTEETGCGSSQDVEMWPTLHGVCIEDATGKRSGPSGNELGHEVGKHVDLWATAAARDGKSGEHSQETWEKNARPLNEQAVQHCQVDLWASPRSNASTGAGEHGDGGDNLQTQVCLWTTPQAHDVTKRSAANRADPVNGAACLASDAEEFCQTGPAPASNAERTESGGQLSPEFVCWLQGFPSGWQNFADSETALSQGRPRKSSNQS